MTKRVFLIMALCIAFVASPFLTTQAQDSPAWEVTFFNGGSATLMTLTPNGISSEIVIPEVLNFQGSVYGAKLSPDRTKLAFTGSRTLEDGTYRTSVYVADLAAGTCCLELVDPLNSAMDGATMGPFSPDSSQIAVALFSSKTLMGEADVTALISTFDVNTGIVTANKSVNDLYPDYVTQMQVPVDSATFGEWRADGVRVAATCLNCYIGVIEGLYQVWEPVANTLSDPIEPFHAIFPRRELPGTGESIQAIFDEAYPASGAFYPEGVPPNVIRYFSDATQAEGQVLYQHPTPLPLNLAQWVLNGQAVLVTYYNFALQEGFEVPLPTTLAGAELIFRDGTILPVPMTDQDFFLTGTPDGWLTRNYETNDVTHYQVLDGVVTTNVIAALNDGLTCCFEVAGVNPPLGSGITPGFAVPQ
jgi:hypothetical protein